MKDSNEDLESGENTDISLLFTVSSTTEAASVSFTSYDPSAENPVGSEYARVTVEEATQGFHLATPPSTQILDPEAPGMTAAIFVPALLSDTDQVLGVGAMWPTWVEGEIPESYQSMGLQAGWNAVEITPSHSMIFHDPLAMTLENNLASVTSLALQGSAVSGDTAEVRNSEAGFGSGSIDAGAWSLSLSGTPTQLGPLNGLQDTGTLTDILALQAGQQVGSACSNGESVQALYLAPTTSVAAGLERLRRGISSGWGLVTATFMPVDATLLVSLQSSCP